MEALLLHEAYPFATRTQTLMRAAVREIQAICYVPTHLSLPLTTTTPTFAYGLGKPVSPLLRWGAG